jgi:formiminotetrahydrofolate cyclodeaminase
MIKDASIENFLETLASRSPTPGGGSVVAVMGAMGAALVAMVCHLTIGKVHYEAVSEEMEAILHEVEAVRATLLDFIRADVEAFDAVMAAYGLPKVTDEEKGARSSAIQQALKGATRVPLDCAKASRRVIELSLLVAEHGNTNVITDAGVAALAAHAALKSSALNVRVNTGNIKDSDFVRDSLEELDALMAGMDQKTHSIYQLVLQKL